MKTNTAKSYYHSLWFIILPVNNNFVAISREFMHKCIQTSISVRPNFEINSRRKISVSLFGARINNKPHLLKNDNHFNELGGKKFKFQFNLMLMMYFMCFIGTLCTRNLLFFHNQIVHQSKIYIYLYKNVFFSNYFSKSKLSMSLCQFSFINNKCTC